MRFVRSLLAVIAGFGIFWAALRWLPIQGFLALLSAGIGAGIAAGYVASFIAGIFEVPHSAFVGIMMVAWAFVTMLQQGLTAPGPYQMAIAGCGPVSALIGAALRVLTKKRKTPPRSPAAHNPTSA